MKAADVSMPIPSAQIRSLRPRDYEKVPRSGYATNNFNNTMISPPKAQLASTLDASGGPDMSARLDFYKSERSQARRANSEMEVADPSVDNNQKRFAFQKTGRDKLNLWDTPSYIKEQKIWRHQKGVTCGQLSSSPRSADLFSLLITISKVVVAYSKEHFLTNIFQLND